ncbi:MAG: acetate/propionate family kinase, partial [Myxococcaceae bacterium]|nr:acetate/propionate family kinase [Myxococcaceae bacterium]
MDPLHLLTLNVGSSSLKAALYAVNGGERRVLAASAERIGQPESRLRLRGEDDEVHLDRRLPLPDAEAALQVLLRWLQEHLPQRPLDAVGHRLVHGGPDAVEPQRITPALHQALGRVVPLDPDHLSQALRCIALLERLHPALPQVACFDTAFHAGLPEVARTYALPSSLREMGVRRYGFHGLSYESIVLALRALDPQAAEGRLVVAHLGSGASMAALHRGRSVDTSMGLTPLAGLVMGTRCGDVDPGALLYLMQVRELSAEALADALNRRSGLLGVSGTSPDMRELLAREEEDPRAGEAVALF